MHGVLSWQRTHTQKNHIVARYHAESNMACVDKVKSQHFQTMGTPKAGKEWLLPEEALFLIERGTLDCRWPVTREVGDGEEEAEEAEEKEEEYKTTEGAPMSLQSAYAAFLGFEGGVGGKLTLEMYNVYAGLKRSGYVVFRTGSWGEDRGDLVAARQLETTSQPGIVARFFSNLWRRLRQPNDAAPTTADLAFGPMIKPGLYRSYADIYRLLRLIPAHSRTTPPAFLLPPSPSNPFRLHFDVYRTTAKFRKSARGPPDFRVCVIDARTTPLPTGAQLNDLFAQVPDDRPSPGSQPYQRLKHGSRNVVLAVVDNGMPSYLRLADSAFEDVRIYERAGPRGKGGRGRGRGRGGRGRGRGR